MPLLQVSLNTSERAMKSDDLRIKSLPSYHKSENIGVVTYAAYVFVKQA